MKIVVLATDCWSTWALVNSLKNEFSSLKVVLEEPVPRTQFLKRRVKKLGLFAVFGQVLFLIFQKIFEKTQKERISQLLDANNLNISRENELEYVKFSSANSEECINWLISNQPDIVVLNGTRIISKSVLEASKAIFLNIHCGITPAYRGVHGGYWAIYQNDALNAGVTVHVVDAGIDTGDIIFQDNIDVDKSDNFLTYPVKQYIVAIPLMHKAIQACANKTIKTFNRADLKSHLWHHPTLWQYLAARVLRGIK